jgi:molecular chaperone GrpE
MTDASPLPPNLRRRQRYQLRRRRYGALTPESDLGAGAQVVEVESAAAAEELEQLRERLLRVQADHENHRKRMLREREEQARFALEGIMHELILSMDNFERALEHRTHTPEVEAFAKGLELTHRQLWETLAKNGLEKIEALGKPFDPHVHEAMATTEAEGIEDGTVLDVIQEGYSLSGRVLRPALVRVAKSKTESAPASD